MIDWRDFPDYEFSEVELIEYHENITDEQAPGIPENFCITLHRGDLTAVESFLHSNNIDASNINDVDDSGHTLLSRLLCDLVYNQRIPGSYAYQNMGSQEEKNFFDAVVNTLLQAGADIRKCSIDLRKWAFIGAAQIGNDFIVSQLLEDPDTDVNAIFNDRDALHIESPARQTPVTSTALSTAIEWDQDSIVALLLASKRTNVNAVGGLALCMAIYNGNVSRVKQLLAVQDINVNAICEDPYMRGATPLSLAARIKIFELLVNAGAEVNSTYNRRTILVKTIDKSIFALHENDESRNDWDRMIDILLQRNDIDINSTGNEFKNTALNHLIKIFKNRWAPSGTGDYIRSLICRLLEVKNIDVNIPDDYDETPLINAVLAMAFSTRSDDFIVGQLLKAGADVNRVNKREESAAQLAQSQYYGLIKPENKHIINLICSCESLQALNLDNTCKGKDTNEIIMIKKIFSAMIPKIRNSSLYAISFRNNSVENLLPEITELIHAGIQKLDLSDCNIDSSIAQTIFNCLANNNNLVFLDMVSGAGSVDFLDPDVFSALVSALENNRTLEILRIHLNQPLPEITDIHLALLQRLKHNTTLVIDVRDTSGKKYSPDMLSEFEGLSAYIERNEQNNQILTLPLAIFSVFANNKKIPDDVKGKLANLTRQYVPENGAHWCEAQHTRGYR